MHTVDCAAFGPKIFLGGLGDRSPLRSYLVGTEPPLRQEEDQTPHKITRFVMREGCARDAPNFVAVNQHWICDGGTLKGSLRSEVTQSLGDVEPPFIE